MSRRCILGLFWRRDLFNRQQSLLSNLSAVANNLVLTDRNNALKIFNDARARDYSLVIYLLPAVGYSLHMESMANNRSTMH